MRRQASVQAVHLVQTKIAFFRSTLYRAPARGPRRNVVARTPNQLSDACCNIFDFLGIEGKDFRHEPGPAQLTAGDASACQLKVHAAHRDSRGLPPEGAV